MAPHETIRCCEICDDPEACWSGRQMCYLGGIIRNPETGQWADVTVLFDPCIGLVWDHDVVE